MVTYIVALVFLLLALMGETARKTYYYIPVRELKRQAEAGDTVARKLYPAVAYGSSLRVLLWLYISVTAAVGVVLLAQVAPVWLAIIAVVLLLWVFYSWLPATRVTKIGTKITALLNPVFLSLLNWLHPALSRGAEQVSKRYTAQEHTGLYEKADLLELIERQQQLDARFSAEELEIASRALRFSEYKVRDILTPRASVKTVAAHDTLGPVVIDELHKTEQPFALVSAKDEHDIVGVLAIHDLGIQSSGKVRDHMQSPAHFVHENDSLADVLSAYHQTNSSLFVVTNSHEEYVGVVTIGSVLKQRIGELPADDFEDYANRQAVARRHDPKANLEEAQEIADQLAEGEEPVEEAEEPEEDLEDASFVDGPTHLDLSDPSEKPAKTDEDIETIVLDEEEPEPENLPEQAEPNSSEDEDDADFEIIEEDEDDHPAPR